MISNFEGVPTTEKFLDPSRKRSSRQKDHLLHRISIVVLKESFYIKLAEENAHIVVKDFLLCFHSTTLASLLSLYFVISSHSPCKVIVELSMGSNSHF